MVDWHTAPLEHFLTQATTTQKGWQETTLGAVSAYVTKKVNINEIDVNNYISTENILADRLGVTKASSLPTVSKVNIFKKDDILFSNIRTYFKKVWHAKFHGGASNDVLIFRPIDENNLDKKFLYYLISSDEFINFTVITAKGTKMPRGDKDAIKGFPLSLPPLPEQKAIAHILGSLDDKIELNRQMNETLEEMARALFRDWFIDFGPTRRQMDGATDPAAIMGHAFPDDKATALAPLFPARLTEGGLPEGWLKGILESIANSPRRGIHPTDVAENTPYIGLEHMPRRSIALGQWEGAGKATSNKSVFKKGDLLFGKLRPYFHKVGRAPVDGICSTDIVVISPKSKEWDAFVTSCLSSDSFVEYTNKTATGTRMPRTSWKIMAQYVICFPPEPVARAFQDTVEPLLGMIHSNIHETHTLAQMRDLLLPKLMSGEIQLKDAPMVQDTLDEHSQEL